MRDLHEFIHELRGRIGLDTLAFDADGRFELVFGDTIEVTVHRVADRAVELACTIDDPVRAGDSARLARILSLNHLGQATGAGRLALDPVDGALVLCERIDLDGLDGNGLEARMLDFVQRAAAWSSGELDDLLDPEPADDPAVGSESFTTIRV